MHVSMKVTKNMISDLGLEDEYFFKDLAKNMIDKMTISQLEKILELTKKNLPEEHVVCYEAYFKIEN